MATEVTSAVNPSERHLRYSSSGAAIAGGLMVAVGIVLSASYPLLSHRILHFLQARISCDHRISRDGARQLTDTYYLLMAALVLSGSGLVMSRKAQWRVRIRRVFLDEPLFHGVETRPSPRFILWASSAAGLFLIIHMKLYNPSSHIFAVLYKEDGVFESLTPIVTLTSAYLLGSSVYRARKTGVYGFGVWVTLFYAALTLVFIMYAGEEISWGQRILGWQTPRLLVGNEQHETNIHNYFNHYFGSIYRVPALLPLLLALGGWLEFKRRLPNLARLVLPHPGTIGLACLIALVSIAWYHEEEMLEEMCAVFALFYSLRIYGCVQAALSRKRAGRAMES